MSRNVFFTGYLLERPERFVSQAELLDVPGMGFVELVPNSHWEEYRFESHEALMGEDPNQSAQTYVYRVLARRSGERLVVVARGKEVGEHLLGLLTAPRAGRRFKRVRINVNGLVHDLIDNPGAYVLSGAHAEVPAYGASLSKCAFWGDDLGDAEWFRESLAKLSVYACGLRSVERSEETVRVGNYGTIGFWYRGEGSVLDVEHALHFLRTSGHLPEGQGGWDEEPNLAGGD